MNDTKNILLAWASSTSTIIAAFEGTAWISVVSAIVLPILFFGIGKTVDVLLQMHFRNEKRDK